jgi:hypothetical protein
MTPNTSQPSPAPARPLPSPAGPRDNIVGRAARDRYTDRNPNDVDMAGAGREVAGWRQTVGACSAAVAAAMTLIMIDGLNGFPLCRRHRRVGRPLWHGKQRRQSSGASPPPPVAGSERLTPLAFQERMEEELRQAAQGDDYALPLRMEMGDFDSLGTGTRVVTMVCRARPPCARQWTRRGTPPGYPYRRGQCGLPTAAEDGLAAERTGFAAAGCVAVGVRLGPNGRSQSRGRAGRLEPIKLDSAQGTLGLGKATEYEEKAVEATAVR